MNGRLKAPGMVSGKVQDARTLSPIRGARVWLAETAHSAVSTATGGFQLKDVPANIYRLECRAAGYEPFAIPRLAVSPGGKAAPNCQIAPLLRANLAEPVVLLPLRLEIRRMTPAAHPRIAMLNRDTTAPKDGRKYPYVPFLPLSEVEVWGGDKPEFWLRWYPDELQVPAPVGRFTEQERAAWGKFKAVVQAQTVLDADKRPDTEPPISVSDEELEVLNGVRPGVLKCPGDVKLADSAMRDTIVAAGKGIRASLGWQDMESPPVQQAWREFASAVGVERARHIARHFMQKDSLSGGWEFDAIFPIRLDPAFAEDLREATPSPAFRAALAPSLPCPLSPQTKMKVVARDKQWTLDDPVSRQTYHVVLTMGGLDVQGDEDTEPFDLLLNEGATLPTLPERVHLYTVKDGHDPVLLTEVTIDRERVRYAPTELDRTHWLTDFEETVRVGMGVKIQEPAQVALLEAADWLFAVGLCEGEASRDVLTALFKRHVARGELAIVPQDSPTNNTESCKPPYADLETDSTRIVNETRMRLDLKQTGSPDYIPLVPDARLLCEALGLPLSALNQVSGGHVVEQEEAAAIGRLLWAPCTALARLNWSKSFSGSTAATAGSTAATEGMREVLLGWNDLASYFAENVRARGPLPVVRIVENPYGILPVVSLRDWEDDLPIGSDEAMVQRRLKAFVQFMKPLFLDLAREAPKLDTANDDLLYEELLAILRQNAVSNQLDLRPFSGEQPFFQHGWPRNPSCPLVRDTIASGTEPDPDIPYPETAYLDFLDQLPEDVENKLPIDEQSPVLKRLLHMAIHYRLPIFDRSQESAKLLKRLHPAKLEILLMEVLDLLSHRLDAWMTSLATVRLRRLRLGAKRPPAIGVYGWLERPGALPIKPPRASFIQAPSESQASAAALMYSAAEHGEGNGANGSPYRINLASARVRRAAWYLEGLRERHPPGELLGATLERRIREDSGDASSGIHMTDLYDLRTRYPLSLQSAEDEDGEYTDAPTIIDGLAFLEKNEESRFEGLRAHLTELLDSAADLAMWEAVHQTLEGNAAAAGAWLDFQKGDALPPELRSIQSRHSGDLHGTRVFLPHFPAESYRDRSDPEHPRTVADPILADWCDTLFAGALDGQIQIRIFHSEKPLERYLLATLDSLGLTSIDLLLGKEEELRTRARYYALRRWREADPADTLSPFYPFGAMPALHEIQAKPYPIGVDIDWNPKVVGSAAHWLGRAAQLRRILHGHKTQGGLVGLTPDQVPCVPESALDAIDPVQTLRELVDRMHALLSELGKRLSELVGAVWTLKLEHLARTRLERCRRAAALIREANGRGEDVSARIVELRERFRELFDSTPSLETLMTEQTPLSPEDLREGESTFASLPADLPEQLGRLGREYEGGIAGDAAAFTAGLGAVLDRIARFGFLRALTPLPAEPAYADIVVLLDLCDALAEELAGKALAVTGAAPAHAHRCEALAAIYRRPGAVHRILVESSNEQEAGLALQRQLKLSADAAAILAPHVDDVDVDTLTDLVDGLRSDLVSILLEDLSDAALVDAFQAVLEAPAAFRDALLAGGADALEATPFDLPEASAAALAELGLTAIDPFDPTKIGRYLLPGMASHYQRVVGLIRNVTDGEVAPVLMPNFLRADDAGARPAWPISFSGLVSHAPSSLLGPFASVRPKLADTLRLLGSSTASRAYLDRRQQRVEPGDGTGIREGTEDFVYLAQPVASIGVCFVTLPIDQWEEGFPNAAETTGVAILYDSPTNEAPHAILIAVPPIVNGKDTWTPDLIAKTLLETTEQFRIRMVQSERVRRSGLGNYLPALLFPPKIPEGGLSLDETMVPSNPKLLYEFAHFWPVFYVPWNQLTAEELGLPPNAAVRASDEEWSP